ncbi:MAG TPA: DUF3138 family protein [Burkholderiaceae bacterium]|jgi:hypothetical protein|nr:DUF3138 family protein [Burkholderiaceae bacterium]
MNPWQPTAIALALAAGFAPQAFAQSNEELLKELRELKARVQELEAKQKAMEAKGDSGQWGMTPAQQADLNRVTVKTEAIEDERESSGQHGLKISGQMQAAYIYNQAQNMAGFQFLDSVADYGYNYDNSYIGMAIISFEKEMEGGTIWKLSLAPQRGVGSVIDGYSVVQEASVSIPLTDLQTRFIAGQIPDWSGYEYLEPTKTPLITHNLLFDFTLPTGYIGAGFDIVRGKWQTKAMLAQMNQNANHARRQGSVGAFRVDYAKGEFDGFGAAGVYGSTPNLVNGLQPDGTYNNSNVGLIEVDGYFIRGDWTLQGQLSYGKQKYAAITRNPVTGAFQDASWWGLSALAAYSFTPRLQGIARFDYIDNSKNGGGLLGYGADNVNGIGPDANLDCATAYVSGCDKGANRYALSLGLKYVFNEFASLKAEYRYDWSNLNVFENVSNGTYRKNNNVLGAAVVVGF